MKLINSEGRDWSVMKSRGKKRGNDGLLEIWKEYLIPRVGHAFKYEWEERDLIKSWITTHLEFNLMSNIDERMDGSKEQKGWISFYVGEILIKPNPVPVPLASFKIGIIMFFHRSNSKWWLDAFQYCGNKNWWGVASTPFIFIPPYLFSSIYFSSYHILLFILTRKYFFFSLTFFKIPILLSLFFKNPIFNFFFFSFVILFCFFFLRGWSIR